MTQPQKGDCHLFDAVTFDARHLYTIRLREPAKRDGFIEKLRGKGICCSVHFIPLHIMPYYRERYSLSPESFPNSYKRYLETVSLPLWPGMTNAQVDRVIDAVLEERL